MTRRAAVVAAFAVAFLAISCGLSPPSDGATDGGAVGTGRDSGPAPSADATAPDATRPVAVDAGEWPAMLGDLGHGEGETEIRFANVTAAAGLEEPLDCMMGHGAAAGDVDGDGFADLFFGTFSDRPADTYLCGAAGARSDRLLLNRGDGTFAVASQPELERYGRTSGAAFADLDGDGDLDLVVSRNANDRGERGALSNALYRNDAGRFVDVTAASGIVVPSMKARNIVPLDYDGDDDLDLFIVEDLLGSVGSRLFRNDGDLRFTDATADAGLPIDLGGLGAAAADVNADGWPDLFVAHEDRLFMNDGSGRYVHASGLDEVFHWPGVAGAEDWRCGVAFGDVNRDGMLDLVVSHHYDSAYTSPVPVRLYLNRGARGGVPSFEDVTAASGLAAIPSKAPHVEIQDIDNDGWPDVLVSVHALVGEERRPLVFANQRAGTATSTPRFAAPAFTVPYSRDGDLGYWAAAPTLDYDRDGLLDVFGAEWFPQNDSLLYANESRAGNFIEIEIRGAAGTNPMGIGARIEVYEDGGLDDGSALVGTTEIMVGFGYSSGQEAVAHVGAGARAAVDVRIVLPHGGSTIDLPHTPTNQRVTVR